MQLSTRSGTRYWARGGELWSGSKRGHSSIEVALGCEGSSPTRLGWSPVLGAT